MKFQVLLSLGLVTSFSIKFQSEEKSNRFAYGEEAREMLCLVNKYRDQNDLPPLYIDDRLMLASYHHSIDQARGRHMSHYGSSGDDFNDRSEIAGYYGNSGAENVAFGQDSVEEVMDTWINSPGHEANILSDNRCFGYAEVNQYWTQNFGDGDSCSSDILPDCSNY